MESKIHFGGTREFQVESGMDGLESGTRNPRANWIPLQRAIKLRSEERAHFCDVYKNRLPSHFVHSRKTFSLE